MADREKAIRGLIACKNHWCAECPYAMPGMKCCGRDQMFDDAITLLKEREPRVMTLEELQAIGMQWNRNTPPYLLVEERSATGPRWMSWGFMHDFVRLWGNLNAKNYGSKWRVWNLQPTPEQMRETSWEGDSDAE